MPILSSGARCVRLGDARSPLSPGLCLVSTSDVALLCRIFDVVLGLVSGARVPNPGLSRNTWAVSLLLGSGSWVQLGLTCPELVDGR